MTVRTGMHSEVHAYHAFDGTIYYCIIIKPCNTVAFDGHSVDLNLPRQTFDSIISY